MSTERILVLEAGASPERINEAAALLAGGAAVALPGVAVVRETAGEIRCELREPAPAAHRCEQEYRVLVENAARGLERSGLYRLLPPKPIRWVVLEEDGAGTVQLWP